MWSVNLRRVEGGVKVEHRNVQNPHPVEVDQKMCEGAFLIISLEEYTIPVNTTELRKALCRGHIHETCLIQDEDEFGYDGGKYSLHR